MLGFEKKNYLKRTDFINLVDSKKIWSKSMTMDNVKILLIHLEKELSMHDYVTDKNFMMNNRRKSLKRMVEERLHESNVNKNELVCGALFNFWEFVGDEYPGNPMETCRELGLTIKEFDDMDKAYREKGIICAEEKEEILEMIKIIEELLNKENNNFDKISFLKSNYKSPEQWAESIIEAHSHHEPINEKYLERLKKCKTWDDVLILSEEVVPFLMR